MRSNSDLGLLTKSISWNIIGMSAAKILLLALSIYAARILGSEDFGKWSFIRTSISMFGVFLGFGLSVTPLKFVAKYIHDKSKIEPLISLSLLISAILGSALTLLVFLGKEILGDAFKGFNGLEKEIGIAAFFLFATAMNSCLTGILGGFARFKLIALANFIAAILSVPFAMYLTQSLGLIGLIYGYLIYYFLQLLFLFYFSFLEASKRNIKLSFKHDFKEEFIVFKSFSLPSLVSALIGGPAVWVAFAIVANLENGFVVIGLYSAARIFQNSIMELTQQLNAPLISLISRLENSSKSLELVNFTVPWILAIIMIFPIMFFPELVTWLFDKGGYDQESLAIVISISLTTTYLMIFKQAINRKIITEEKIWWGVYGNIFWAVILITSTFYLAQRFGAIGLAGAFFLASLLDLVVSLPIYIKMGIIDSRIALSKGGVLSLLAALIGGVSVFFDIDLYFRAVICVVFCSASLMLILKLKNQLAQT